MSRSFDPLKQTIRLRARMPFALALGLSVGLTLSACGDDAAPHEHDGGAGHAGHGEEDASYARCPDTIPEFATGLIGTSESGELRARLVRAAPTPPRKKAPNDWTIQFIDESGEPVTDVTIADACAFMPVHSHGASTTMIELGDEPGEYDLGDLIFSMRGPWQVQLAVSRAVDMNGDTDGDAGTEPADTFTRCDRNELRPAHDLVTFDICVMDE